MNFGVLWAIVRARLKLMLTILGVTVGTALLVSLILPATYKATSTVVIDSKGRDPVSGLTMSGQLMPAYLATQTDIITSHNVAGKVVDMLKLTETPVMKEDFMSDTGGKGSIRDYAIEQTLTKLEVLPSGDSSAINITMKARDPKNAAALANAFAQAYIHANLELRTGPARQVNSWYQSQIEQLRKELDDAQSKLSAYQREHGLFASDERMDVETARLADLSSQLVTAQTSTYDSTARSQQRDGPDVVNNPVVQDMRRALAAKEAELAQLGENYGPRHPAYKRAKAEADALRARVAAEMGQASRTLDSSTSVAVGREDALAKAVEAQKKRVLDLKQQRDAQSLLVSDVQNAQRAYDTAVQRHSQTRLEAQTSQTDIAVLNEATPPLEQDSPKILLNVILAIMLGGLLAGGAAFVMEALDRRLRVADELAEMLDIPVLAVFPPLIEQPRRPRLPQLFLKAD